MTTLVVLYALLVLLTWAGVGLGACPKFTQCDCYLNEEEIECYDAKIDKMTLKNISETLDPSKVKYLFFYNNSMTEFLPLNTLQTTQN